MKLPKPPRREIRETDVVEFRYQSLPEFEPDLIFVDGPSHLLAGHNLKNVIDSNALDFAESGIQPIIIVSARRATVDHFEQELKTYRLIESDLLASRFHRNYKYFSTFEPT